MADGLGGDREEPASNATSVRVFLRLRPTEEKSDIELFDFSPARPKAITIKDPLSSGRCTHNYEYSGILGPGDGQEQVFRLVAGPVVEAAARGNSGCVLAYGQTCSGKTFSVFGEGGPQRGILPRAMERLFQSPAARKAKDGQDMGITVSFLEVYLDQIYDLGGAAVEGCQDAVPGTQSHDVMGGAAGARRGSKVRTSSKPLGTGSMPLRSSIIPVARGLEIHESTGGAVFVQGLSRLPAYSMADVERIMERGFAARKTASTAANVRSSRSHTIFTVHLPAPASSAGLSNDSLELNPDVKAGLGAHHAEATLSFVDLAGSERLAKTKAEGERFREAVAINCSLTALGKVVLALATEERHVPYRDSKLTRILSQALGGGAQVSLLATVHPRVEDYEESLNTLSFADRCKNIIGPQVSYATQQTVETRIAGLQSEAAELRAMLARQYEKRIHRVARLPWAPGVGGRDRAAIPVNADLDANLTATPTSVEKLDQEIDSAIVAALVTLREGKKRTSDPAGVLAEVAHMAATDPSIRGLIELQEQRRCQAHYQVKAQMKIKEHTEAQTTIEVQKRIRTTEAKELQEKRKGMAAELECLKAEISAASADQAGRHIAACQEAQDEADKKAQQVNLSLQQVSETVKRCADAIEDRRRRLEDQRDELGKRHVQVVRALKQQKSAQFAELQAEWQERIASQDQRNAELARELPATREREQNKIAQCQKELLTLCDLVAELAKIISDVESGILPVLRQSGAKAALLPAGLVPQQPTQSTHPILFEAIETSDEKLVALERAGQCVPPGRTRLLVKMARGGFEGVEYCNGADATRVKALPSEPSLQVAARPPPAPRAACSGAGAPGASLKARLDATQPLPVGQASNEPERDYREVAGARPTGGRPKASGAERPGADDSDGDGEETAAWDASELAHSVCEAESEPQAEGFLASLTPQQLRQLCVELRSRALDVFDPDAERDALRQEVAQGLAGEATQRYLRTLERRRDAARAEFAEAAERERGLRCELELRRSALMCAASRPCSAATRLGSGKSAPGPRSRSLSKKHFGPGSSSVPSTRPPSRGSACPSLPSASSRRGRPGTACTVGTRPSTASGLH